jgi:hypothetical protein
LLDKKHKKEYDHEYYLKNKRKYIEQGREWRKKNLERSRASSRIWQKKIRDRYKIEIFQLLGMHCSNPNCPIPSDKLDWRGLQIDHINGGGTKHRNHFGRDPIRYLKDIKKQVQEGSRNYQLLCAYCNWMKRYERNEFSKGPFKRQ